MPASAYAYGGSTVEKLNVNVIAGSGTEEPPPRIAKRMAASVNTVGEHVILGKKVGDIEQARASYERLVKEVFDRILVGYSVDNVTIEPGSTTSITVEVVPWGEVVREVSLEIDYGGLSPEYAGLIKQDLGNIEEKVADVLIGLPIDAVDWAGGVSKTVIQEILAEQLPEFRANCEVTAGSHTTVRLSLLPAGATVQEVKVSLRSHTIPNLLLFKARPALEQHAKSLNGLPVAFVERHRDYFTAQIASIADKHQLTHKYGLTVTPAINPGTTTEIVVNTETDKFNIWIEGYLDIGRQDNDTSGRLHLGKYIGNKAEAFAEVDFIPSTVTWKFSPGISQRVGANTTVGMKYNVSDKEDTFYVNQPFGKGWSIRAERSPAAGRNELGLRYRLHDYISAEYVINGDDSWLRLVGNL